MRNGQNKRMRGRNRRNHNPMTRVYESNGPDVKIRGTAHHIAEKYVQLARDAQTSGDPVAAESYLQHAEHYFRMIALAQAQFAQQNPHQPQQQYVRNDADPRDEFSDDEEGDDMGPEMGQPPHPGMPGSPQPHYQPPQPQPPQPQFRQPHPQHQPQPSYPQQQPQHQPQHQPQQPRRPDEPRDPGLPAFITGSGGQAPTGNGFDAEQGDRGDRGDRGGRFGRRRRFRPRGPGDFEPRNDRPDFQAQGGPAAPASEPSAGGFEAPKPTEPGE
jgi:hypothetical protein